MRDVGSWIRILGATVAAVSGCASSSPPAAAPVQLTTHGGDRSECLAPPWTPAGSSAGVRVSQCENKRVYRFVLGDGAPASDDAQNNFLSAHRSAFHGVDGIVGSGNGLCCIEDKPDPADFCLAFQLRLCSTPLPAFIETVRELQVADSTVANRALRIAVELQGPTAPRCRADDDCGPLPYSKQGAQTPPPTRTLLDPPESDSETCSHDGECVANGCGNECDHWTRGGTAGRCPYLTNLEGAFCGCVESHCAWFH